MKNILHYGEYLVGDYPFAESLNQEVFERLKYAENIGHTNVKAQHTIWNWEPDNQKIINFKSYIKSEIEKNFRPTSVVTGNSRKTEITSFWANIYSKGDYAEKHNHKPFLYSFAYFVQCKWYDSPLIFTDSKIKIRPKNGRYVIFPSYLWHHVPKHRYNHSRVTLSGNLDKIYTAS